ncbi:MAG: AAA family ATPase [Candidatus Sulfobium sp.]|jgi:pilus assembly protein CpaE
MPKGMSVVVIDTDVNSINAMVQYIRKSDIPVDVEGVASNFNTGYEMIHKKKPSVIIMDICGEQGADIKKISTVLDRFPGTSIFAVCDDSSTETILSAMRAGAAEYLLRPINEADLVSAFRKLERVWGLEAVPKDKTGRICALFSPKGGVGVTTLAINLAANIFQLSGKSTILVDLDLSAGDVSTFLNLSPSYTISDVTVNISRLDRRFLKSVVTRHDSGIFVLAEPHRVEEGVSISEDELGKVLELLKKMFDYIIIDTQTVLDRRTMAAVRVSDLLLLPFVLSLPGIKNVRRHLSYFERSISRNRVKLIVNRYHKKGDIGLKDAEEIIGREIFSVIPNAYDLAIKCLNKGVPFNSYSPDSELNTAIRDLAVKVAGEGGEKELKALPDLKEGVKRPSRFSILKSLFEGL